MTKPKPPATKFPMKSIYGIFTAALLAFTSLNFPSEASKNHAYRDPLNRPAICNGHTNGVKMTDTVSDEECKKFLYQDLFQSINSALSLTPHLVDNRNALRATSEFIMGTDENAYKSSPMYEHFQKKNWTEGCNAFRGYMVHVAFKHKKSEYKCFKTANGAWICEVPELVKIRNEQAGVCLGQM